MEFCKFNSYIFPNIFCFTHTSSLDHQQSSKFTCTYLLVLKKEFWIRNMNLGSGFYVHIQKYQKWRTWIKKKTHFGSTFEAQISIFWTWECFHRKVGKILCSIRAGREILSVTFGALRVSWCASSKNLVERYLGTYPSAPKLLFEQELYESHS